MAQHLRALAYGRAFLHRTFVLRCAIRPASTGQQQQQQQHELDNTEAARQNYEARVDLAAAYRGIDFYGLSEGVCNHLSFNAPAKSGTGRVMLLIPYGLHWKEVTASKLLGLDFDTGEILEGEGETETTAVEIQRGVHKVRPDIRCCFHMHAPYTTALGLLKEPYIRMVHQNALRFYGNISYDTEYDGYGTSAEEGLRLGKAFGKKSILMMGGHGVAIVSTSISMAFDEMYFIERTAMFQVLAMSTGKDLREIPEEVAIKAKLEANDIMQMSADAHFNAIKRLLRNTLPDYTT